MVAKLLSTKHNLTKTLLLTSHIEGTGIFDMHKYSLL